MYTHTHTHHTHTHTHTSSLLPTHTLTYTYCAHTPFLYSGASKKMFTPKRQKLEFSLRRSPVGGGQRRRRGGFLFWHFVCPTVMAATLIPSSLSQLPFSGEPFLSQVTHQCRCAHCCTNKASKLLKKLVLQRNDSFAKLDSCQTSHELLFVFVLLNCDTVQLIFLIYKYCLIIYLTVFNVDHNIS